MSILISIVIPLYNGALLIERCLNSVFNQTGDYNLEVIVVDDGSTDNSLEILNSYVKQIKIIKQNNQGPAAARNKGIEKATGKYLAFLDADDYWNPAFLQETVIFLEKNDTIAVSVAQIHEIPGKSSIVSPKFLSTNQNTLQTSIVLDDFYVFWGKNNHVCTGSVLMLTGVVKQTGGQRIDLLIAEDLEFWAYLATYGKWGFIPKILLTTDGGLSVEKNGYLKKNKKRWNNAPSVENWESRILLNINDKFYKSFDFAKGMIVKMLIYSYIQSFRLKLAHYTVQKYSRSFPNGKVTNLYKFGNKFGYLFWLFVSILLISRELIKSFRYYNLLRLK